MRTRASWQRPAWLTRHIRLSVLVLGLLAVACAGHLYRKGFIRAFFIDGPGRAAPPRLAWPAQPPARLPEVARVRVVLIDGLSREHALRLARLDALCARGHDLTLDTGFPTVSLPVQQVLWTGLTQAQTGVMFRGKREILERPALGNTGDVVGIPARVQESTAVAESHPYIVHALGFARVFPESATELPPGWSERGFMERAEREVASDARLVFVHVLGVDVAGHRRGGRDSPAYQTAVLAADDVLGRLVDAEARAHAGGTRWLVLSDHGHRGRAAYAPGGGHGGAEPDIRVVRACLADTGAAHRPAEPRTGYVHLVDLSRTLADSLGVDLPERAAGRPLLAALAAPVERDATLPAPGAWRAIAALVLLVLALVVTGVFARGCWRALPFWWPMGLLSLLWLEGTPSLSHPMVYRALHPMVFVPLAPGLFALALQWLLLARSPDRAAALSPVRAAFALLTLPLAGAGASIIMAAGRHAPGIALWSAGLGAPAGLEPPLMPGYTAHASMLMALAYGAALVSALCLYAGLAVRAARHLRAALR